MNNSNDIFSKAIDALTAWLHGQDIKSFDSPLEALKIAEKNLPDTRILNNDIKEKIHLLSEFRFKLGLPNLANIYSVEDASMALVNEEHDVGDHAEQRRRYLADFIRESTPNPRLQQFLHGGDAHQFSTELKPPPGYDFAIDATGYSDDLVMQSFNRNPHDNATYFEKYLMLSGKDRKTQLAYAREKIWVLSSETGITHDAAMLRRPKLVEEAHPFFISHQMIDKTKSGNDPGEKLFMIDQPFKTIWLERTDGGALFHAPATTGHGWCLGILVHEDGPGAYYCEVMLGQEDKARKTHMMIYTVLLTPETAFGRLPNNASGMPGFKTGTMIQTKAHDVLYWTFRRFRSECAFANEKIKPIRMRIGTGKDRAAVKINRVVRVMLKTERKEYERVVGRVVDWTHKWEVMGHWRKVDGVGKDRDGNYTMRGVTWVAPHVKGKGDLVKKQRVVVEGDES